MGKTIEPTKKTKSVSVGRQSRVDRIINDEANEEIKRALFSDEEESFDTPRVLPKRIIGKRILVVSAEIEDIGEDEYLKHTKDISDTRKESN